MAQRVVLCMLAVVALHEGACATDTPAGGPNAPCTRESDCQDGLTCSQGMCVPRDSAESGAGVMGDSGGSDVDGDD